MTPRAMFGTALSGALLLGGCGKVTPLRPPPGGTLPPAPYGATERPSAEALLAPTTQQRPGISDSLLIQSELRRADPFDLTPGEPAPPLPPAPTTPEEKKAPPAQAKPD